MPSTIWFKTQHYNFDPGVGDATELITDILWKNDSSALYLYKMGVTYYYISSTIGSLYKIDGANLTTYFYKYNGYRYFNGAAGYLWYDTSTSKWIISAAPNYGVSSLYAWWNCATLIGTYAAQGIAAGTKVVTRTLNGWRKNIGTNVAGSYAAIGTETGTKSVGYRVLITDYVFGSTIKDTLKFTETLTTLNGEHVFTSEWRFVGGVAPYFLWKDTAKWVISWETGVKDATIGYWESAASSVLDTYTRVYTGSPPSPAPASTVLSLLEYVLGSTTRSIYITEVGAWL